MRRAHADSLAALPPSLGCCSLEQKAELLHGLYHCLRPGGVFCLLDPFLADGESQGDYLARFRPHVERVLTDGERSLLV